MHPVKFPEQTIELQPNPNQLEIDGQAVGTLPIFTDGGQCISCWRLSWRERINAVLFGNIWLYIHTGRTQPPVALSCERTAFRPVKGMTETLDA